MSSAINSPRSASERGMSRRAIAECLDVSHTTVPNNISGYGGQDEDGDFGEDDEE